MVGLVDSYRVSAPAVAPLDNALNNALDTASDEECVRRLEAAIGEDERLGEVAALIGRLAVPLEV